MTARIAVLASGGGSNLQALLDHLASLGPAANGEVVVVISNRADAHALQRARNAGISAHYIPHTDPAALMTRLEEFQVDLVVLAGYLKLVPPAVTSRFPNRVINIHPGPLPTFGGKGMYGLKVHSAVLDAGVAQTAITVHFVNERYDEGAIITQWPVSIAADDTPESLAARVLTVEHIVYPRIIDALSALIMNQRSSFLS